MKSNKVQKTENEWLITIQTSKSEDSFYIFNMPKPNVLHSIKVAIES